MTTFFIATSLIFLVTTLLSLSAYSNACNDNLKLSKSNIRLFDMCGELESELAETIEYKKSVINDYNTIITEMNIKNYKLQSQIEEQLKNIGL